MVNNKYQTKLAVSNASFIPAFVLEQIDSSWMYHLDDAERKTRFD